MSEPFPRSRLVGLIGSGIQASRTPGMHESEARFQGVPYVYRLLDLDRLGMTADALSDLLDWSERMGFEGLNITHPCKQRVIPLLSELSADAQAIGAVNTVVFEGAKRIGHNTDGWGYAEGFKRAMPSAPLRKVVQLGAGGAGAAVAHALMTLGVGELVLFDSVPSAAQNLAAKLAERFGATRVRAGEVLANEVGTANGLVNATPMGMAAHPGLPLPEQWLRPSLWVSDIVYFPIETALLKAARSIGCRTMDGSAMAVFQAARALHLFSGLTPDIERMFRTFHELGELLDR